MFELSTDVQKPKPWILPTENGDVRFSDEKAAIISDWLTKQRSVRFIELKDENGDVYMTLDRFAVKGSLARVQVPNFKTADGIYCEWGIWHMQYPFHDVCNCLKETGVPWWDMVKARKSFYPRNTRPEGCPENALRKKERETLVVYCHEYYAKNLPVPNPPKE